jgi:hypothetical protein
MNLRRGQYMRLLVTHDSGGGAALMGLVTRLRARAAQHGVAPSRDDDLAVATMHVDRKLARWTR